MQPTTAKPVAFDVALWTRAARRGSQQAFAELYTRFAPLVHAILLGRTRPALADELTQECFALAFARLDQLREDGRFGAWIAVIARRIELPSREALAEVPEEIPDPQATPEQRAEAARVLGAISSLPEAYRETLMLRLVEGLGGAEIAALTGLGAGSVRVNLHRGMRLLRAALGITEDAIAKETSP
ncbi:MAG TPA: sigma-70 family RNA polymerase sigma factor [Dokdonella sp.]|uniref:RNA polymerase sigma factor n=1 Tax=Dokdonella sp. TaxID=2291710 RepID=UPI0025BDC69B|nr:sigma-70 family RNA polymerase sigma factor [Dokdonella sp.]MBX3690563.1 sigma-70 family RNA polymerase sigma factor [Dokdonella sp.]MCW5567210.1 sigma-70 family RNA polymerase sigma factor [Dokdonella sp.]HNR91678.1 sigma-70 family RNA polymerase sigma factor [Dokdonella sp.]